MAAQKETVGFSKGGGDQKSDHRGYPKNPVAGLRPTLAEAGIDRNLAKAFTHTLQGASLRALGVERPQNNCGERWHKTDT